MRIEKLIIGFHLLVIAFCFFLIIGKIWVAGSLLTSGVKAISGHCDSKYGVETVLSGDWFCPSKKESK